jgi:hypothetical protein
MHSRATDRRSASKCQGKLPDQAVKHRSDGSHPPSRTWAFQPIQKTATIHVSSGFIWGIPDEEARDVARALAKTKAFEQSCRDRKRVEMLFAHLKRILRLGRLRLRGPCGAQDEFTLAAIAQNLWRLAKWVLRPPPLIAVCTAYASRRAMCHIRSGNFVAIGNELEPYRTHWPTHDGR